MAHVALVCCSWVRPEAPREGRLGQRSSALARTMSGSCGSAVSASGHRRSRLRFGRWTRMRLILGLLVVDPQPLEPLRPAAIQDAFHPHLVAGRPPRPTHDRSPRWARSSGPGHDERLRSRMRPTQPRQGRIRHAAPCHDPTTCSTQPEHPPSQVTSTARSRRQGTGTSEPASRTAVHRRDRTTREETQMATTLVLGGTGKTRPPNRAAAPSRRSSGTGRDPLRHPAVRLDR